MPETATNDTDERRAILVLVVFALAVGLWDFLGILTLHDSFLPPTIDAGPTGGEMSDWSAANAYPAGWKTAVLRWGNRWLPGAALTALVVLGSHLLLWGGVYFAGRSLFGRSPWVAVLGVVLVRIMPDLFQIGLLHAQDPSRLAATALVFWSMGLLIRRRWITACCAAGLMTHCSPTIGVWFLQGMIIALACFQFGHGWRRSATGAAAYLAIAAGPLVWFLVGRVWPDSPIEGEAMIGLHLFVDPALSPFSVSLWAIVCLIIYVAMACVWMRDYYSRRTSPLVVVLLSIGFSGFLVEIIFVGLIPVERALRFELHVIRALWILWLAMLYAPVLADELASAWRASATWRAILRGMILSLPVVWTAWTLLERLWRAPRWNRTLVAMLLILLGALAFVMPHGPRPTREPLYAAAIVLTVAVAAVVKGFGRGRPDAARTARAAVSALCIFALLLVCIDGTGLVRVFADTVRTAKRHGAWTTACRWIRDHTPPNTKASAPWRPREFRRLTGRAVLVNRGEVPAGPSRRYEWFERYAQTHVWSGGPDLSGRTASREQVEDRLRRYRRSFLLGASRRCDPSGDSLLVSRALVQSAGVRYAVLDADRTLSHVERGSSPVLSMVLRHSSPPFVVYEIRLEEPGER